MGGLIIWLFWLFVSAAATLFPIVLIAIVGFFIVGGILGFFGYPKPKKKKAKSKKS